MDFVAHYRRACELADQADTALAHADTSNNEEQGAAGMRRAEVLAQMATARGHLAWVAYLGVDAVADHQDRVTEPERSAERPSGGMPTLPVTHLRDRR